jgi:eukaryotic-like serine/threonine-protein kinase
MPDNLNRRYSLENGLGSGGIGAVYRANDKLASDQKQVVAFKRVQIPIERLTFASQANHPSVLIALAQELQNLASLRHPHVINVLDYGFEAVSEEKFRPFYTTELLENPQTIIEASRNRSFEDKMRLVAQMLQALIFLHRRGILHRNLKPDNVLVVNDRVRLMDGGLAIAPKYIQEQPTQHVNTLAYLAPEMILAGKPASIQSDLYAVGLLIYEILTGEFPYQKGSAQELLANLQYFTPNTSTITHPELAQIVGKLLTKVAEDRYESAYELLEILQDATGLPLLQEDFLFINESFLQSSKLVGRDNEMTQLNNAVQQLLEGKGSAWLIAGESGVGKSRLLTETRTLALVRGVTVLRAYAVNTNNAPYRLWQPILRGLAIAVELSNLEASVLKSIVPDIETVLQKSVENAPLLDPKATQMRLLTVLYDMFTRFLQTQALVVLLDDLHWADQETLDLLRLLLPLIAQHKFLIVGNFRNDEKPALGDELPSMTVLPLRRLNVRYISELTQQILGAAGELPIVNALLYRETEGNVFFLVEVMRTLAEQVGDLSQIGIKTLPEQLFVGGIQEAITRRLERVPESDRALLSVAALMGRDVDTTLLKHLNPDEDVEQWLYYSGEVAVLEWVDERWAFAHDKLREGAIARLSFDQKRAYHAQIAQAIEAIYGQNGANSATLAYHWGLAQHNEKEYAYAQQASETAIRRYAISEALQWLTRAYELSNTPKKRATVAFQLGDVYQLIGETDRAKSLYEEGRDHALQGNDIPETLEAAIRLANFWRLQSDYAQAHILVSDALSMPKADNHPVQLGRLLDILADVYLHHGEYHHARTSALLALQNALKRDDKRDMALALGKIGYALFGLKEYDQVDRCYRIALYISTELGLTQQLVEYQYGVARLYEEAYSIYAEALAYNEQALAIAQDNGFVDWILATQLFDIRLNVFLTLREPQDALAELANLVRQHSDNRMSEAIIRMTMWRVDDSLEQDKMIAQNLFSQVYSDTHNAQAAEYYQELSGKSLPPAPVLPSVPNIIKNANVSLDALLQQAQTALNFTP